MRSHSDPRQQRAHPSIFDFASNVWCVANEGQREDEGEEAVDGNTRAPSPSFRNKTPRDLISGGRRRGFIVEFPQSARVSRFKLIAGGAFVFRRMDCECMASGGHIFPQRRVSLPSRGNRAQRTLFAWPFESSVVDAALRTCSLHQPLGAKLAGFCGSVDCGNLSASLRHATPLSSERVVASHRRSARARSRLTCRATASESASRPCRPEQGCRSSQRPE